MALEERIQEEMYVDTESLLEDEFDRAKELYDIYDDNTVVIADQFSDIGNEEKILIHLIAWRYIAEANADVTSGLDYDYFYERIDAGDSTIRGYFSDFSDESLVRENEDGNKELVVERLSDTIDRIEAAPTDEDN